LWHRLGEKTRELIGEYISDVEVSDAAAESIAIDAGTFEVLRQLELFGDDGAGAAPPEPPTIDEVLDTLEARLRRKLAGGAGHPVWRALSERLDALRSAHVAGAAASVEFLKSLLDVARQVVEAERAEGEGRLDEFEVLDPDRGALTQILREFAPPDVPVIVANVVEQIDAIVRPIRGTGWQESQPGDREVRRQLRVVLRDSGLPPSGDLYDRAYGYIREHY
jgi:type I restriction enzyme R subunit